MKQDIGYNPELKAKFGSEGKKVFRQVVKHLNLNKGEYHITWNKGGIAGSGDIILMSENLYLSLSQRAIKRSELLLRKCNGMKDFTGEQNHYAPVEALEDPEFFANYLQVMLESGIHLHWNSEQARTDVAHWKANKAISPELEEFREAYEDGDIEIETFECGIAKISTRTNLDEHQLSLF